MIAPNIIQVIPQKDHTVYVYFEDGKIVQYDVKPLLDSEVFRPLNNVDLFINTCCIMNDTLSWDITGNKDPYNSIDIDPETLYELEHVEDILKEESII